MAARISGVDWNTSYRYKVVEDFSGFCPLRPLKGELLKVVIEGATL